MRDSGSGRQMNRGEFRMDMFGARIFFKTDTHDHRVSQSFSQRNQLTGKITSFGELTYETES